MKVAPPTQEEICRLQQGAVFIGFLQAFPNPEIAEALGFVRAAPPAALGCSFIYPAPLTVCLILPRPLADR